MSFDSMVFNIMPSRNTESDFTVEHALSKGVSLPGAEQIPESVDLREPWWTVGNQEGTGSCIGWAVADGLLRWHFVKAKKIPETQRLSPRFIWMASKELDIENKRPTSFLEVAGTFLKDALEIPLKFGAALEEDLPFKGGLSRFRENDFFTKISALKISNYFNLMKSGDRIINIKKWISSNGPVLVSLSCDQNFIELQAPAKLKAFGANSAYGVHALVIAGYTKDEFILRNSWGPAWGDKGFGYASEAWLTTALQEAYGIVV